MDLLPKEIEDIIIDYKCQLETQEKYKNLKRQGQETMDVEWIRKCRNTFLNPSLPADEMAREPGLAFRLRIKSLPITVDRLNRSVKDRDAEAQA